MKTVKRIVLGIVALIVLVLVVALFAPGEYTVERFTEINRPKTDVFNYVKHIRNQDKFSVWNMTDPNIVIQSKGEDGTVGFISSWDSQVKNVGKGEQEIVKIEDGESIDTELRFYKPWEGKASARFLTEPSGADRTIVRWRFKSKMPYPMNVMMIFMNPDSFMGKDMQQSLDNLKKNLEKEAVASN